MTPPALHSSAARRLGLVMLMAMALVLLCGQPGLAGHDAAMRGAMGHGAAGSLDAWDCGIDIKSVPPALPIAPDVLELRAVNWQDGAAPAGALVQTQAAPPPPRLLRSLLTVLRT